MVEAYLIFNIFFWEGDFCPDHVSSSARNLCWFWTDDWFVVFKFFFL